MENSNFLGIHSIFKIIPFCTLRIVHVNLRSRSASCPSPAASQYDVRILNLSSILLSSCYRGRITMRRRVHSRQERNLSLTKKRKKLETNLLETKKKETALRVQQSFIRFKVSNMPSIFRTFLNW